MRNKTRNEPSSERSWPIFESKYPLCVLGLFTGVHFFSPPVSETDSNELPDDIQGMAENL